MVNMSAGLIEGVYHEWKSLPHREKAKHIEHYAKNVFGCSSDTLRRRFKKLELGQRLARRADHGKPRVADMKTIREDMMKVSAIINGTSPGRSNICLSTEEAIEFAWEQGWLHQKYSTTTANRYLNLFGGNRRYVVTPSAAIEIIINHSNDVWYVDATPANQIFLPKSGSLVRNASHYEDRSHSADRLKRDLLDKIWIYVLVDGASRAYFAKAFAGLHLGENTHHWIDVIGECMLPKKNGIPIQGRPNTVYSDKGSGLTSKAMERFFNYLEIVPEVHMPGNPRAKGKVESRIGAIKKRIETLMSLTTIETVEQFNSILQARVHLDNQRKGHYDAYLSKLKNLRACTAENIIHAQEEPFTRKVNRYGCISVESKEWFVDWDMVGRNVNVTRTIHGLLFAEDIDGRTFECKEGRISAVFGSYHGVPQSERRKFQTEAIAEGNRLRKLVLPQDLIPEGSNVTHLTPSGGTPLEKSGRVPLEVYNDVETAWLYIAYETGFTRGSLPSEIRDAVDQVFDSHLNLYDHIDRTIIMNITEKIKKEVRNVAVN